MLLELDSLFLRKLLVWVPGLEHGAWVLFGADVAGSEGGLVGRVLRVVGWVGQRLGLGAEPSGSRVEGVVGLRDVHLVESVGSQKLVETLYLPSGGHSGNRIVDHFLVQDSTALLSEPLLQVRVRFHHRDVALVLWNHHVFPFDRFALCACES